MATRPSSSGWRIRSSTWRWNLAVRRGTARPGGRGDFTRTRLRAAANERGAGDRMMRRTERPPCQQPPAAAAGHRVDGRAVERLVESERRQDRGQPACQHRLASARRPAHQQVVPPGCGDLERPAGRELAVHVGEIGLVAGSGGRRHQPLDTRFVWAVERIDRLGQRPHRAHLQSRDHARLAGVVRRQDDAGEPQAPGRNGNRQHAADTVDPAVERELTQAPACRRTHRRATSPTSPAGRARSGGRTTSRLARRPAPGSP